MASQASGESLDRIGRPPITITDPRRVPGGVGGIRFAEGRAFHPGEHAVIMLHSLWQAYPRDGADVEELIEMISDEFRPTSILLRVCLGEHAAERLETLPPREWDIIAQDESSVFCRIPNTKPHCLGAFVDGLQRRCKWLFEFVTGDWTQESLLLHHDDLSFPLLVAAANARRALLCCDTDDDALECILPLGEAADRVVTKLISSGLAKRAGDDV